MTAQLFVNGQEKDFEAFVSSIVSKTIETMTAGASEPKNFTPEFTINPGMMYNFSDIAIQRLFGVDQMKHPNMSIYAQLRKYGIEPNKAGRRGATILGSQILLYQLS